VHTRIIQGVELVVRWVPVPFPDEALTMIPIYPEALAEGFS
jgi:hypothetical protein